ncbi:hypothetical protein D3C78_1288080 [compost metagenome]
METQRALDEVAEGFGQVVPAGRVAVDVKAVESHLVLFAQNLIARHFAIVDGALQKQPGGHLHQAGGEAHRFRRIEHRGHARQHLGSSAAGAIEITCRFLNQGHAFGIEGLELVGSSRATRKAYGI